MAGVSRDTLRAFRARNPSCALLALSDIRAGTVLLAHGDLAYPQEYLDAISRFARDTFAIAGPRVAHAIFRTPEATRLVVRGPQHSDLALTALAPPDADCSALLEALAGLVASLAPRALAA